MENIEEFDNLPERKNHTIDGKILHIPFDEGKKEFPKVEFKNKNEIKLLKNNDRRDLSDIEWVTEFYNFLQGEIPDSIKIKQPIKLTPDEAFMVVWYLQEHFSILPDEIEKCDNCGEIYDSGREGVYLEEPNENGQSFCNTCDYLGYSEQDEE